MENLLIEPKASDGTKLGTVRIYFSTKYDAELNRTAVTFDSASFTVKAGGYITASASISVVAADNAASKETARLSTRTMLNGFNVLPEPKTVYVAHGADAGEKSITLRADVSLTLEYEKVSADASGSTTVVTGWLGLVNIDVDGWKEHKVYIDTASGWKPFVPYIDTGSGWERVG